MPDQPLLTHDEVRAIADLARLSLSEDEVALYARQLSAILDDFQKLQQVDTAHLALTTSVLPPASTLRADTPLPPLTPAEVVANAPAAEGDQFKVSAVLGDE
ncbi:MAG: Asp-tRNA(Asn)/Glu-tRNA(Gln) amidotransferase subunit GatC [Anaerolineae bacterium]|jgi:aspartyl-tRNA(Asn)/glutamyl-tRNA(Gln) amidotransferase subunit C|nr:Asp-tRNA(Asn)/Glu-tRNA(Gln) amidotransferase subunit GatC [Anaerolineae bacterium]